LQNLYQFLIKKIQVVQVLYYAIALVNDFIPSIKARKLRDYTFASFALPLALMTSLMFWTMCSIDRELVFPKALDAFFPHWLDLVLHTNVSIFIFLDLFISQHQYPRRTAAIRGLTLFMLSYLIWVYVIKINTGKWVYGIIGVLSAPQRIFFFGICGLVALGLFFIGEFLNKLISGRKLSVKAKGK
jgi:FAR-17a/AIG1-like protein